MTGDGVRKLAAGLLACGLAASAPAQDKSGEALEKARLARQVADATAESDVKEAIRLAKGVAQSAPEKALQNLKAAMVKLNAAVGISESKRGDLSSLLEAARDAIQKGDKPAASTTLDPKVIERIQKSQKVHEAAVAETKDVQAAIADIAKDVDNLRTADVKRKIAALAAKYPTNAAVIALQTQQGSADSIAVAKDIAQQSAAGFRDALNGVQVAAIPMSGDIQFPKDWVATMERRRKLNAPTLTAEERKLIDSLAIPITKELKNAPFEEAVQMLSTTIDQKIYLDKRSLEDLGVDMRRPVDVPAGVSARSAMRLMLQQQNLTFVVRDNIIQVLSIEKAKEVMVSRAYDVRDLVAVGGPFNGPYTWGPLLDYQQTMQNAQMIVDAIQKSIDPKVWREGASGGGPATIVFNYTTMSIIVRAPSEVHADLYDKLSGTKGKK